VSEFVDYLHEVFERFGPVEVRRMFGGYGIYHDGLMFALVDDDTLYLKADAGNISQFEQRGLHPFTYNSRGRTVQLSYYLAPGEMLEDRDEAAAWARRSFEAAIRSRTKGGKRGKKG
jgi:DNA transformation protein